MQVYLAGPMPGQQIDGEDWRDYAIERIRDEDIEVNVVLPYFLENYVDEWDITESDAATVLTHRDYRFSTESDFVLANFTDAESRSMGTCIELGWADAFGVTVITVLQEGWVHWHPMVRECSDFIVPTLDDALGILGALAQA